MLGAIIGDMVGSQYEFDPIKTKKFNIFSKNSEMTDDSYLTLAVAKVLMNNYPIDYSDIGLEKIKKELIEEFVDTVDKHIDVGFGGKFYSWARGHYRDFKPYNSFGNGSAMRISPVGWIANSIKEVKLLSKAVTEITHNHPEGLKGAEAVAMCIYLARKGKSKLYIRDYIVRHYYPRLIEIDYNYLCEFYTFDETCQGSVPEAIFCFLISKSVEDAVRTCVEIGGDCDTTGAMAGSIAEAFFSRDTLSPFEDKFLRNHIDVETIRTIVKFHKMIGSKKFDSI